MEVTLKVFNLRQFSVMMIAVATLSGCATIVNGDRQQVFVRGGVENGMTKLRTPDGTFDVENGAGAFMMTRSKSDIPVKVDCPNGTSKNAILSTHYDWAWGGAGNILNYGIGYFVDPFTRNAYIIDDVALAGICDKVAH